ncbi:ABC transporter permease subunit [Neptunicella marina]|uniref:ABC transporter permease subunit n=1 Tax=Neptunicella marina TaxID=2125989 RepID=A0A8J6IVB2_9ALTE|nr:ABC transporter permease subunit [Neptunicella marina]MBC3766437.1 ABC transporter permease subunit [Neptunicella marina]
MGQSKLYLEDHFPSPVKHTWIEFRRNHVSIIGLWIFLFFVAVIVFAPGIAPFSPTEQNTDVILLQPAWDNSGTIVHLFGTDSLGRDVLSRVIHGSRVTFGISILIVLIAMLVGFSLGAFAGMGHGLRASVLNHLLDAIMVIPTLIIAIIIVAIFGTGLTSCMWAITLSMIPKFIHLTRDLVRNACHMEYVTAARLDGASNTRILFDSILPNMIEPLVVNGTFALSVAILELSALGFLNLGAQAPTAELGAMLSDGLEVAYIAPWNIALPGAAILLMLIAVNLVGDGLRTALRNRLQQ